MGGGGKYNALYSGLLHNQRQYSIMIQLYFTCESQTRIWDSIAIGHLNDLWTIQSWNWTANRASYRDHLSM